MSPLQAQGANGGPTPPALLERPPQASGRHCPCPPSSQARTVLWSHHRAAVPQGVLETPALLWPPALQGWKAGALASGPPEL